MAIKIKESHKGRLHSALGVKQGEKISTKKLHSSEKHAKKGSALSKEINFAVQARKWSH